MVRKNTIDPKDIVIIVDENTKSNFWIKGGFGCHEGQRWTNKKCCSAGLRNPASSETFALRSERVNPTSEHGVHGGENAYAQQPKLCYIFTLKDCTLKCNAMDLLNCNCTFKCNLIDECPSIRLW